MPVFSSLVNWFRTGIYYQLSFCLKSDKWICITVHCHLYCTYKLLFLMLQIQSFNAFNQCVQASHDFGPPYPFIYHRWGFERQNSCILYGNIVPYSSVPPHILIFMQPTLGIETQQSFEKPAYEEGVWGGIKLLMLLKGNVPYQPCNLLSQCWFSPLAVWVASQYTVCCSKNWIK